MIAQNDFARGVICAETATATPRPGKTVTVTELGFSVPEDLARANDIHVSPYLFLNSLESELVSICPTAYPFIPGLHLYPQEPRQSRTC